jgi:hypothetical protein
MAKLQVVPAGLNLRSSPGTQYPSLKVLKAGDQVTELSTAGWRLVSHDGKIGWVSAAYVKEVAETEEQPQSNDQLRPASSKPAVVIYENRLTDLFGVGRDPAPYLKVMDFGEFKKDLSHVKDYLGRPWSCRIYGHELMEAPLRQAFQNLVDRGYALQWLTYEGCLSIRPKTAGNDPSTHSWGLAIDLNAGRNGYGKKPTLSPGFVKCFTDAGFTWGGSWHTPDGMHFQLPKL